jgi:hypothetical protein
METRVQPVDRRADVQPNEAFRWTTHRDAELIDGQAAGKPIDIGGRIPSDGLDPFELFPRVEDTDRVKI